MFLFRSSIPPSPWDWPEAISSFLRRLYDRHRFLQTYPLRVVGFASQHPQSCHLKRPARRLLLIVYRYLFHLSISVDLISFHKYSACLTMLFCAFLIWPFYNFSKVSGSTEIKKKTMVFLWKNLFSVTAWE